MAFEATLVVMAAGMGSRFGGLKQVEPIGPKGEALLDFSVYDAKAAGFTKVVFVIKHEIERAFKETVGNRIAQWMDVAYVFQETDLLPDGFTCPQGRTKPWGTAQAIWCCRNTVHTPFAVINADDYYGPDAFGKIFAHLRDDVQTYGMVGFRLKNTLTENGSVSRGVCCVENGQLSEITERTHIENCRYTENDGATWVDLSPDTVVSMNFWGFTPDIFDYLEQAFVAFLRQHGTEPKTECYLPMVVADLIATGKKRVTVLESEDQWYGVTYRADKDGVVAALAEKIAAGQYKNF